MNLQRELPGYDARSIANLILTEYNAVEWKISNKKINKLIYFVHGMGLVRLQKKITRNYFEAWEHGPVVRVVYDAFKRYRFSPISELATNFDVFDQQNKIVTFEDISSTEKEFILAVSRWYLPYSADELEEISHEPGSPWDIVRRCLETDLIYQNRIPDILIREHFQKLAGERQALN